MASLGQLWGSLIRLSLAAICLASILVQVDASNYGTLVGSEEISFDEVFDGDTDGGTDKKLPLDISKVFFSDGVSIFVSDSNPNTHDIPIAIRLFVSHRHTGPPIVSVEIYLVHHVRRAGR